MVTQMRYFGSYIIVSFLILILIGQTYSALGQVSPIANHVVINEADINPVGNDMLYPIDWVQLYNPTGSSVNISGWIIGATTGLKMNYTVPNNTIISSKQYMVITDGPMWFPHAGAVIQLRNAGGTVVDQTPPLTDTQGGGGSWQRLADGYDTGSPSDWVYRTATPGSVGQLNTTATVAPPTITINTDKSSYTFGNTVTMSGTVSQLLTDPITGYPLSVNILLAGPTGFQKAFTLYPNPNLQFTTSITASQVTGFPEGNYTVSASYGTISASTSFTLASAAFVPPSQSGQVAMSISTDQPSYTVSQLITLSGNVSQVIPLATVVYKVYEPNGTMVSQGNLFPDSQGQFTTYNPLQENAGSSGVLINRVNPIYGSYTIIATYGTTNATTSFTLVTQQIQTVPITISTDKQVYGLGDTVQISGGTQLAGLQNSGLTPNLEIIQSSLTNASASRGVFQQNIDIKTFVKMISPTAFTYSFQIPNQPSALGDYRAIVSVGSVQTEADFAVVQNPSTYQAPTTPAGPLSIITDKLLYAYGDQIVISGKVQSSSLLPGNGVQISVINSTGGQLYSQPNSLLSGSILNSQPTPLSFNAYPDSSGNYLVQETLTPSVFVAGTYTLKAFYNNLVASTTFTVYNPLNTGNQGPIVAALDKQVYGVGDTVHLTGKLSSTVGATAYTLDLLEPDGNTITTPLTINDGLFSWSFKVPSQATFNTASTFTTNQQSSFSANSQTNLFGIYTINIESDYSNLQLYFQVSPNPQNQTTITPFVIETDKAVYNSTDVVNIFGQAMPNLNNNTAQYVNNAVQLTIYNQTGGQAYQYSATLNQGGQFQVSIQLQPGSWPAGTYNIYAQYLNYAGNISFQVVNPYATTTTTKAILMSTDHPQYLPGQTVTVSGRTSFIMSVNYVYLTFGLANDTIISEGQPMSKHGYALQYATVPLDQYGAFSYAYKIPASASFGNYTVIAEAPFGFFNTYYQVVSQLPPAVTQTNATQVTNSTMMTTPTISTQTKPTPIPTTVGPTELKATSSMIIDKETMIPNSQITIPVNEKTNDSKIYYPAEIDGLLRVNPGDEGAIALNVALPDGICMIGSSAGCKIAQSTSQAGLLYQSVTIGNETLLVGFTGPDMRIQQFSILPANTNGTLPMGTWNVDIVKNNQVSRFYYQVTYTTR